MITILGMGVVMYPAGLEIYKVGRHDQDHGGDKEPGLVLVEELLQHQKDKAGKNNSRG